jgi:hypothetical protein
VEILPSSQTESGGLVPLESKGLNPIDSFNTMIPLDQQSAIEVKSSFRYYAQMPGE